MNEPEKTPPSLLFAESWCDGATDQTWSIEDPAGGGNASQREALAQQLVMHGLLLGQYETATAKEKRIRRTMDAFDRDVDHEPASAVPAQNTRLGRPPLVFVFSTAAMFLIAFMAWALFGQPSAEAALRRVLITTEMPVTRVYSAISSRRFLGREFRKEATLYSHSDDRFLAVFPETKTRPKGWIGFDGTQRWLLGEDYHWTSKSAGDLWVDDIVDRMTSRSLHFHRLLSELPKSFTLRFLPYETIDVEGRSVSCRPIEALPRDPATRAEQRIVVWPHPETGVVMRMQIDLKRDRPLGVRRLELQFQREEVVPDDFFTLPFHQR